MTFSGSEGWSCGMGTCAGGIPTSVHWTFFFVWMFQIIFTIIMYASSWKYILNITILWGPVLILTILLHEWGHVARNRSFGGTCSSIMLWPLGGFSNTDIEKGTCLQEFWVALFGPLTHIPQLFVWMLIMALCAPQGLSYYGDGLDVKAIDEGGAGIWFAQLSKGALDLNIMIFFLNLLVPAYPLDAARMLAAMSVHCGLSIVRAAWMLLIVGGVMGALALIYGIISLISGSGPGTNYRVRT
jgi:Zn-dependent protease